MSQQNVDRRVQEFYSSEYDEAQRLTTLAGQLELTRVRELLGAWLPAGSRVLDVGGGTGVHAAWLAAAGHEVTLLDPVPRHVEAASAHDGVRAQLGDARELQFEDGVFDAALLFGPLYHLQTREDRVRALAEARRAVRPGGLVFAQVITRWAVISDFSAGRPDGEPADPDIHSILDNGGYELGENEFPAAHFHTVPEFEAEIAEAGLALDHVEAVEGPAGAALELAGRAVAEEEGAEAVLEAALTLVRFVGARTLSREISNHVMAIARV